MAKHPGSTRSVTEECKVELNPSPVCLHGFSLISLYLCARYKEGNIQTQIQFRENARYILAAFCYFKLSLGNVQEHNNKYVLITLSPAKNGALTFFGVENTFFGDLANFAETLQAI